MNTSSIQFFAISRRDIQLPLTMTPGLSIALTYTIRDLDDGVYPIHNAHFVSGSSFALSYKELWFETSSRRSNCQLGWPFVCLCLYQHFGPI